MTGLSLKNRIGQNLFRKYQKQERKIHDLSYLFWECTLRCPLNCLHCGSDCTSDSQVPDMPAKDFIRVLQEVKTKLNPEKLMVVITGGEPTLRKDLPDIGREIRKLGFLWGIVTNGMLYTPELHRRYMQAGMGAVTVSLDGLEKNHNWLRNSKFSFDRAVRAIELIQKEKTLNYDIVSCINQRNINELDYILHFLESKKVKAWRLFTIAPIGRARENDEMLLSDRQLVELMDFIANTRLKSSVDVKFSCEAYTGPYENKIKDGYFFCRAGINIGSVLIDGSISACPNIDRAYAQGNIHKDSFTEIWENKFQVMRNRSWTKQSSCKNCPEFKNCNGGAMHLWNAERNELEQCHFRQINNAHSKQ